MIFNFFTSKKHLAFVFIFAFNFFNIYPTATAQDDDVQFIFLDKGQIPTRGTFQNLENYLRDNPKALEEIKAHGKLKVAIHDPGNSRAKKELAGKIKTGLAEVLAKFDLKRKPEVITVHVNLQELKNKGIEEAEKSLDLADEDVEKVKSLLKNAAACANTETCTIDAVKRTVLANWIIYKEAQQGPANSNKENLTPSAIRPEDLEPVERILQSLISQDPSLAGLSEDLKQQTAPDAKLKVFGVWMKNFGVAIKDEAVFLPTTLLKNMRWPLVDLSPLEMAQGALAKAWPFLGTVQWYNNQYSDVEWAWWTAFSLSFCLDLFHGVEASSWMDFQDALYKIRGAKYQTNFNRAYGYFWGTMFRLIAYFAGKIEGITGVTEGMFSGAWVGTVFVTNQIGSQFGTRGFNALNRLYETGTVNKQTRDFLQQWVRDFFFVLCGAIIGAGGELNPKFWAFFAAQQAFDETLWVVSEMTEQKPVLLIGTKEAFESPDFQYRFQNAFSEKPAVGARPWSEVAKDVKQHVKEVPAAVGNPLFNLFIRPALAVKTGCINFWRQYWDSHHRD